MKDLRMLGFLLLTATLCTLVLGGAQVAYERAAAVFSRRLYGAILEMFEIPAPADRLEETFRQHFDVRQVGAETYYIAKGEAAGTVVVKAVGPGLWSTLEVLLAVAPDRQTLAALRVLAQAETPGLGGRIAETAFQEQFRGKAVRPQLAIVKFAMADHQVDAISGATRTCKALETIINRAVQQLDQALPEPDHNG